MKIRFALPFALSMALLASCGGSGISSDVTLTEKPVETSEAPKSKTEFCKNAALSQATIDKIFTDTNSDVTEEEAWASLLAVAMKMLEDAPNDIRDEAETVQRGLVKYAAILAKYDYDFMAVPDGVLEAVNADSDAAGKAVDKYLEEKCGISQDS